MIFERKIMRKVFGPTRIEEGYWRIKTNQEINDILKGENIIGFIKKQRLNWLGHVERMSEDNNVKKYIGGNHQLKDQPEDQKTMGRRRLGRYEKIEISKLEENNTRQSEMEESC